ncbi:glycoprotein [Hymenopteran arli-related virus OKIAV100]|uniref:Glycoprotein n=1 Tax=Hymenopteran arli-related virus OKIAV100 TaxID=2792564 RepID=A0A7T0M475_9MONO|nr:glycoprotein [Hymenopteran arli-related virus OKIAV100]
MDLYHIVVFCFIALVRAEVREHTYDMLEGSHFYEAAGIVREPAGMLLPYSGIVAVPVTYSVPRFMYNYETDRKTSCDSLNNLKLLYDSMIAHIGDAVDERKHLVRGKRQLGIPIALGLGAALGLYNTYETRNLKDMVNRLHDDGTLIKSKLMDLTVSMNMMVNRGNVVSAMVSKNAGTIDQLLRNVTCLTHTFLGSPAIAMATSLTNLIPREFISAYDSALTGHVHPDLISSSALVEMIRQHPELQGTAYQEDISLIYSIGQFMMTSMSTDMVPTIMGIMYLPKILKQSKKPLYNFYSVNYHCSDGYNCRIKLPDQLACDGLYNCYGLEGTKCHTTLSNAVCQQGLVQTLNPCLLGLEKGDTTACLMTLTNNQSLSMVMQLQTGVLIGGTKEVIKLYDSSTPPMKQIGRLEPSSIPRLINGSQASYILYENELYSTVQEGIVSNTTFTVPNLNKTVSIPPGLDLPEWTPLGQIDTSWNITPDTKSLGYIIWFTVCMQFLCIFMIVFIIFWVRRQMALKDYSHLEELSTFTHSPPVPIH